MSTRIKMDRKKLVAAKLIDYVFVDSSSSGSESSVFVPEELFKEEPKDANGRAFMASLNALNDEDFKNQMSMKRSTVKKITELYKMSMFCTYYTPNGRAKLEPESQVCMFLWFVTKTASYKDLSLLFGLDKKSVFTIVKRIAGFLNSISQTLVKWPTTFERFQEVTNNFKSIKGLYPVLGVIDTIHVKIKPIPQYREMYTNKSGYSSIKLQTVVDSEKRFIDIHCGEPGSFRDRQVLEKSHLYKNSVACVNAVFPSSSFILGDYGYPLKTWLIPPFKDLDKLSMRERKFNRVHNSTRMVVKNAFGLLKSRFPRILNFTDNYNLAFCVEIIIACCTIHNLCIDEKDAWDPVEVDSELEKNTFFETDDEVDKSMDRRPLLIKQLHSKGYL